MKNSSLLYFQLSLLVFYHVKNVYFWKSFRIFLGFKDWKWKLKFILAVFYSWSLFIAILKLINEVKYFQKCIIHFQISQRSFH